MLHAIIVKTLANRTLFWAPRILGLLFAGFVGLFALDAFDGRHSAWHMLAAFVIHLIPTGIVLAILALAWRWEWVGGVLYAALGAAYLVTAWGRMHWSATALISGPLFVLAELFALNWIKRRELRTTS